MSMRYYADLHIHSKYSRATSSLLDFEHLWLWAQIKGSSSASRFLLCRLHCRENLRLITPTFFLCLHSSHERGYFRI
jgi:hypothetical protein